MSIGTEEGNRIAIRIMNGEEPPKGLDFERLTFWINVTAEIEEIKDRRGIVDLRPDIAGQQKGEL